jgi:sugar phosphate isomerase/epimerase
MGETLTRRDFLGTALLAAPAWGLSLAPAHAAPRPLPFKLGVITDEISEDFDEALAFLKRESLGYCELREMWDKNLMNLAPQELERAKHAIQKHRLRVSDIASPLFKYNLPEMPAKPDEKRDTFHATFTDRDTEDLLQRAADLAHFFDTRLIRIFSYWRVEELEKAYPHVRDRLARAAGVAAKHGVVLVLENEHTCNVGTGKELGRLVKEINSPHLRGLWDPGNATQLGEVPFPDGYREVRGVFAHMHLKDVKKDPATGKLIWAPVGDGMIDYRGQFEALRHDEYNGTMALETHYRRPDGNRLESTRESLQGLLKLLHEVA